MADGIEQALRGVDARRIAREWKRDIETELKGTDASVKVRADTKPAERDLEKLEREKHTATVDVKVDKASLSKAAREVESSVGGVVGWDASSPSLD